MVRFSPRHSAQGQGLSPARLDCVLLVPSVALCTFCHFLHLSCSGGEVNPVGMSPGRSQPARAPGVSLPASLSMREESTQARVSAAVPRPQAGRRWLGDSRSKSGMQSLKGGLAALSPGGKLVAGATWHWRHPR